LKDKFYLAKYPDVKIGGANGHFLGKRLQQVAIVLPQVNKTKGISLEYINTNTMDNGYDIVIGDDILSFCEFIYDGSKGIFTLKYFQEA
jgi:hypothetical protein